MKLVLFFVLAASAYGQLRDIPYLPTNKKHMLDVYVPEGRKKFPVIFFVHGGAWRMGDRSKYQELGEHFSREGIGVVIPSYRLAPVYRHPAQIEDVAAAFAWTVRNIKSYGGDASRIYVVGHSAGGHLASLLALDEKYLKAVKLSRKNIAGVVSMSGVYSISKLEWNFGTDDEERRDASPIAHVAKGAPPFLVMYSQWDIVSLGSQARQFHQALLDAGDRSELVRLPKKNHNSEVWSILKDGDPGERAILGFIDQKMSRR